MMKIRKKRKTFGHDATSVRVTTADQFCCEKSLRNHARNAAYDASVRYIQAWTSTT